MNKVTLDPVLRSKLTDIEKEAEFCDESGQTVGFYVPAEQHRKLLYAWARLQVTDQHSEEARQQEGGRTLPEILADLEDA